MWDIGTPAVRDYVKNANGFYQSTVVPGVSARGPTANFASNSSTNAVTIPNASIPWLNGLTGITLSIWWRWTGLAPSLNDWDPLMSSGNFGAGNFSWIVQNPTSTNGWRLYNNGSQIIFGTWPLDQLWHNWTFVADGATTALCYIDGVLISTGSGTLTALNSNDSLQIGADTPQIFNSNGEYFAPKVYDSVLSADKVAWLYAEPFAMLRPVVPRQYYVGAAGAAETITLDKWFQPASQPQLVRPEMIPY